MPENVRIVIQKGINGGIIETAKVPSKRIDHFIVGNNLKLLIKAKEKAENLGIQSYIMSSCIRGEAKEAARMILSIGKEILRSGNPFSCPVCLLFGGETTVTLRGNGRGGRNQEMCLYALHEIKDNPHIVFLSAGTDGVDGSSEAAGAVVDHTSYKKALELKLDIDAYLSNNDSYTFFKQTGDLIQTGPTGNNLMDMTILLIT